MSIKLDSDDVDTDYFTPVASTSLANIFNKKANNEDGSDNASLKYTPPKPAKVSKTDDSTNKATQCVFACALFGYEWCNNESTSKGKLGFAILKFIKNNTYSIILYDSNKQTLSNTKITSSLEVTVKEQDQSHSYISFYDNQNKYWSLYASEDEIKKIIDVLDSFKVTIKFASNDEKGPDHNVMNNFNIEVSEQSAKIDRESDTDSFVCKKTKASILRRMANMGHSILPSSTKLRDKSIDSSEESSNESEEQILKQKSFKQIMRRIPDNLIDNNSSSSHESHSKNKMDTIENIPFYTYINGKLVPVSHNVPSGNNKDGELSIFMSEQRISNSELRINFNRMNDKVDHILDKVRRIDYMNQNSSSNMQIEIMCKLINEYEAKIKKYERLLDSNRSVDDPMDTENIDEMKIEINNLEQHLKDKDMRIIKLENQVLALVKKQSNDHKDGSLKSSSQENEQLRNVIKVKDEEINNLKKKCETQNMETDDIENKIKNIMNRTFQNICDNFENQTNYTGEKIKDIVATVIKTVTVEALNETKI